jgi:hypothetical protein
MWFKKHTSFEKGKSGNGELRLMAKPGAVWQIG